MSPAVPHGLSGTVVGKALVRAEFAHVTTRGSHAKYRHAGRRLLPSPVMTEVCWIFESWPHIEASFLDLVARGRFELVHPTIEGIERMSELVRQYADFPLGAVDASVIAIAERLGVDRVATIDRRHFTVVKPKHVPALTLLP